MTLQFCVSRGRFRKDLKHRLFLCFITRGKKIFQYGSSEAKMKPLQFGFSRSWYNSDPGHNERSPALSTLNNYYWPGTQTSFVLHWKPQMRAAVIATKGKTHKNPGQAVQNNSPKRDGHRTLAIPTHSFARPRVKSNTVQPAEEGASKEKGS